MNQGTQLQSTAQNLCEYFKVLLLFQNGTRCAKHTLNNRTFPNHKSSLTCFQSHPTQQYRSFVTLQTHHTHHKEALLIFIFVSSFVFFPSYSEKTTFPLLCVPHTDNGQNTIPLRSRLHSNLSRNHQVTHVHSSLLTPTTDRHTSQTNGQHNKKKGKNQTENETRQKHTT